MLKRLRSLFSGECKQTATPAPAPAPDTEENFPTVSLEEIPGALIEIDGLLHPQWALIRYELEQNPPGSDLHRLWHSARVSWMEALAENLGGNYLVSQSPHFLFLSQRTGSERQRLVNVSEGANQRVDSLFGKLVEKRGYGKDAIILLDDEDYYRLISNYHPNDAGDASYHIVVMAEQHGPRLAATIAHYLTNNLLSSLALPTWLDEGLALLAEQEVGGYRRPWNQENIEKHHEFWNSENIQNFWSGESFSEDGEGPALSRELSFLLCFEIFQSHASQVLGFIKDAQRIDSGADAAKTFLHIDVGSIVGLFLGDGDWEPQPKLVVDHDATTRRQNRRLILELIRADRVAEAETLWTAVLQNASDDTERLEFFIYLTSIPLWYEVPNFVATARLFCNEGLALVPSNMSLLIRKGALLIREGSHSDALQTLLELLPRADRSQDRAAVYYYLAIASHHLAHSREAEVFLVKAVELSPELPIRTEAELLIHRSTGWIDEPETTESRDSRD